MFGMTSRHQGHGLSRIRDRRLHCQEDHARHRVEARVVHRGLSPSRVHAVPVVSLRLSRGCVSRSVSCDAYRHVSSLMSRLAFRFCCALWQDLASCLSSRRGSPAAGGAARGSPGQVRASHRGWDHVRPGDLVVGRRTSTSGRASGRCSAERLALLVSVSPGPVQALSRGSPGKGHPALPLLHTGR